jgi:hypothetical protein
MAISSIGRSTGTFAPYTPIAPQADRTEVRRYEGSGRMVHVIDLAYQKVNELEYIKWCRRNLGDRHDGWDFWLVGGLLYIEVWGEKQKFTYEMWKN